MRFLSEKVSRRRLMAAAGLAAGGALGASAALRLPARAFAQAAPAGIDLAAYPALTITATDGALALSTPTVPAGFVLVTLVNNQSAGATGAGLLGPAAGSDFADFLAKIQIPAGGGGLSPAAYGAAILGGPGNVDPGQTGRAIVAVPAGRWAVGSDGTQPYATLTAVPGAPGAAAEPAAAATITEIDFGFAGFERLRAGPQVWKVVHRGAQPHEVVLMQVPAGATVAQVRRLVDAPGGATPAPGGLLPGDVRNRGGAFLQSRGTAAWPLLDLPAGRYAAFCFVPDPDKGGELHEAEGMASIFDVGGAAGAATPVS